MKHPTIAGFWDVSLTSHDDCYIVVIMLWLNKDDIFPYQTWIVKCDQAYGEAGISYKNHTCMDDYISHNFRFQRKKFLSCTATEREEASRFTLAYLKEQTPFFSLV